MKLEVAANVMRGGFTLDLEVCLDQLASGIFGRSGAGKSTLLNLISGLLRPTRGRVVLDGVVLDDVAAGIHVPTHRRRLGVVFQHGHLLPHQSVRGNLQYGERLVPPAERRLDFAQVVELLELGKLLERRPHELSGGQRQRVALGRALLCSPRLLLLDEPLAALDRGLKRQILPFLRRVRDACGIPLLHVSHDLGELLHVSDDLLLIDGGRVVAHGTLAAIAQQAGVLPLLHDLGLVNVLRGRIAEHQAVDGVTIVELAGGLRLACPLLEAPIGGSCELLLRPEDIALAPAAIPNISLQNQIPGRVAAITAAADRVLVTVDIGAPLLVEVSARTIRQQGLAVQQPIWCLFKALAVHSRT